MQNQKLVAILVAAAVSGIASAAGTAGEASLNQLAWLAGCWNAEGAEAGSGEHWMPLAGASLLGVGRTVRQGRTVAYEFMRIAQSPDGQLAFFAQPSGKPPAAFPVRSLTGTQVVFESLEHDFPQRVIYRFEPPVTLLASIEGMRNGSLTSIKFPMVRVGCDSQPAVPATK